MAKRGNSNIRSAGGVGESKIFCAPEAERPLTGVDKMLDCHIDGKKIRDLNLDPSVLAALPYDATDEGIAAKEAAPNARPSSGITLGAGEFEKALDQRRDDVKIRNMMLFDSRDPLKEVADRFAVPGMKAKFLSPARVKDNGGTGMYEVVKGPNGDPVTVKGMVLAHTPVEVAEAFNEHHRRRGNQLLKQISEQHAQENGRELVDQ